MILSYRLCCAHLNISFDRCTPTSMSKPDKGNDNTVPHPSSSSSSSSSMTAAAPNTTTPNPIMLTTNYSIEGTAHSVPTMVNGSFAIASVGNHGGEFGGGIGFF